ncbi:MAG: sulfide/dihydroorotate dehydrogenase-like FAD/NAD-binding protein [Candidatus Bathyarchaeota archaeon]|nr:sulfide/dihydroorotate dehydrogenase-like FAD/NAD-binding protein [Candidatus Bathyarchaeota archaeon]
MTRTERFKLESSLHGKVRMERQEEGDFESAGYYETLFGNLINHEATETKDLKKGDICLHFDAWREPYRVGNEKLSETFMEVIIGRVESSEPLTLSEAICLNTYQDSVSYSRGSFTWSRGSVFSPHELVRVDHELFQRLKASLNTSGWTGDVSYDKKHVATVVRNMKDYLSAKLPVGKAAEEEPPVSLRSERDFEKSRFYEPTIEILMNQDKSRLKNLEKGKVYLHFDAWREPYRVGGEKLSETFMEVIIGRVESSTPLTFSEAISLDTYQDRLTYSTGRLTWSSGSMVSPRELIPVSHELLQRLKIVLRPSKWKKDVSFNEKHITAFVRNLENYFTGRYPGKNYKIVQKDVLVDGSIGLNAIISLEVKAPEIATEANPGQFVVLRLHERGERIPLTIADINKDEGSIRLIFQVVGKTTQELATLEEGEFILDVLGPLGNPVEIEKYDKPVICIAGGVGVASIYAKTKALKEKGNYVISIIGARNKDILILEDEMRKTSDELYVTTDDGSYKRAKDGSECFHRTRRDGSKIYGGFVDSVLESLFGNYKLLARSNLRVKDSDRKFLDYGPRQMVGKYPVSRIAEIIVVGPIPMMRAVINVVAGNGKYNPKTDYRKDLVNTLVSLNPIMVDGTGLCGCCRVRIYSPEKKKYETKFACVDGPVFNGLLVDFESLLGRTIQYKPEEERSAKYLEVMGW